MLDFDYRRLLASTQTLPSAAVAAAEDVVAQVLEVSRKKAHKRTVPLALLLPTDDLTELAAQVNAFADTVPSAPLLAYKLLVSPAATYPLEDARSPDGRKIQRAVMAGAFEGDALPGGKVTALLYLDVTNKYQGKGRHVACRLWIKEVGEGLTDAVVELRAHLEGIYLERKTGLVVLRNREPNRPGRAILVVAGNQTVLSRIEANWIQRVRAVGYVQGVEIEQRGPLTTADQIVIGNIATSGRDLLIVWGRPYDAVVRTLSAGWIARRSSDTVIELDADSLEEFIDQLRGELELRNDVWDAADRGLESEPVHLAEVLERLLQLRSEHFIVTEHAYDTLLRSGYPDLGRMWTHIQRLARAAAAWHAIDGPLGERMEDWMSRNFELDIALHDSSLGDAAIFTFEDTQYSREPHVKVDDAKPLIECGRIYFAIDSTNRRIIVDHIGIHL